MSKLVIQPRFRAVGQIHAELQTFEKTENKRQMDGNQACAWQIFEKPRQMYGSQASHVMCVFDLQL